VREFSGVLRTFTPSKWSTELRGILGQLSIEMKTIVMQLLEQQLDNETVLADLNALMAHGDWLSHCSTGEQLALAEKSHGTVTGGTLAGGIKGKDNTDYVSDFRLACRENLKLLITLTPTSRVLRKSMRHH